MRHFIERISGVKGKRCNPVRTTTMVKKLTLEALEDRSLPSGLPAAPSLKAEVVSISEVDLTWTKSAGAENYVIDLYVDNAWEVLNSFNNKTTHISVIDLSTDTNYQFDVGASNSDGTTFAPPVSATTFPIAPAVPDFTVKPASTSVIDLSWTNTDDASSYLIEEANGSHWKQIGIASGGADSDTITGLKAGVSYDLDVVAVNAGGSTWGTQQTATTDLATPSFTAKATSTSEVTLTWKPVTGATSYGIEYVENGNWTLLDSVEGSTKYAATGLTAGFTYEFDVVAANEAGSSWGTPRTVTTKSVASVFQNSNNWSGYAIIPGKPVTAVGGTWVQPELSNSDSGNLSIWVGIDGWSNNSVEQLGTSWSAKDGYQAWIEFFGDEDAQGDQGPFYYQYNIPLTIRPHDTISTEISYVSSTNSNSTFLFQFSDVTENERWSSDETTTYIVPKLSSGEWIVEAPTESSGLSTMPNFGTVNFTGAWATAGTTTGAVNDFFNLAADMYSASKGGGGPDFTSTLVNSVNSGYGEQVGGSSNFTVFYGSETSNLANSGNAKTSTGSVNNRVVTLEPAAAAAIDNNVQWQLVDSPRHVSKEHA